MSQLREHRDQNTSADVAGPLEERVREAGVEFLYYQFVSINGRVLSKVVPAKHLRRSLEKGVQFHGSGVADLTANLEGNLMGGGAEAEEITALPDPETFAPLPWDRSVGRFLCRLYRRDDRAEEGGSPLPTDARGVLERAHRGFEARTGYELRSGCEPEMSWLGESIDVVARPGVSPAYHTGALERVRGIFQRVIRYATEMGFDMIEGDYEDNGATRAQLDVRPGRAHERPARDIPTDLRAGGVGARCEGVVHAEAVPGDHGQRVSPQPVALARR